MTTMVCLDWSCCRLKLGSLSKYDDDDGDNFKKQKIYDQNNSSARASRF